MTKAVHILCAVVMLSLGFAHKPAQAVAPFDSFDSAYLLPDGTYADICVEGTSHELPGPGLVCEACLLASYILVPTPDNASWLVASFDWLSNPLVSHVAVAGSKAVARPNSRGPPLTV